MSRLWSLLIVTKSGVLHISDAQNAENDSNYDCRCGRTLGSRGSCHYPIDTSGGEEPSDEFSTGEYKTRRNWFFKGGVKLCSKCGTPEDFDAAADKYREERAKHREEMDAVSRVRREISEELEKRIAEILDGLVTGQLDEFPCAHEDGELRFWVGECEFSVTCENLQQLVEEAVSEKESRPSTECERASTECGGGS